ncbi:hypothetical protein CPHO_01175 [Corynebacterium phocae]|uniref:Bacterial type II secretion system protein E domain-containing protein n=1 Tax=Corynebacterium phocae TaxID=161895 RepID=A0A1L7D126_9CORY|nr:TadA family conjugal transfer-associated ATPase [Corynebacterium phocae]APT91763.1 hypothetical protein CPHO_01175 [Corynebacterium phocae]KAA8728526.1 TadA family conjugal transfer-associated ATPase [Corynebacterium phocae]
MDRTELAAKLHQMVAAQPELACQPAALAQRIRKEAGVISDVDLLAAMRVLHQDTTGLGVLEPLLLTPGLTDVVVNGPREVFFDRGQGLEKSPLTFDSDAAVRRLATRLAIAAGTRLDDAVPFADGRLQRPDDTGLRIHAVLSPPAARTTLLSIRVLRQAHTSLEALTRGGTLTAEIAGILGRLVGKRVSFLIVGGTGSGKTTLLSALLAQVDQRERMIIIEDTAELNPDHPHAVALTARRANTEGSGEISMACLLRQALRMRPDRIVVGEIRGAEVVDLLAALNTGHEGGAGTLHANSLAEVPARMEALAGLGGLDRAGVHSQLAAAVRVVLVVRRRADGQRELFQIGVLSGNPVSAEVAWDSARGPGPAWPALQELVA